MTRWSTIRSSRSEASVCATYRRPGTALVTDRSSSQESSRTYLLGGDAIFAGGKLLLQATADCDLRQSLETVQRLAAVSFDALLPGHGPIVLSDAKTPH